MKKRSNLTIFNILWIASILIITNCSNGKKLSNDITNIKTMLKTQDFGSLYDHLSNNDKNAISRDSFFILMNNLSTSFTKYSIDLFHWKVPIIDSFTYKSPTLDTISISWVISYPDFNTIFKVKKKSDQEYFQVVKSPPRVKDTIRSFEFIKENDSLHLNIRLQQQRLADSICHHFKDSLNKLVKIEYIGTNTRPGYQMSYLMFKIINNSDYPLSFIKCSISVNGFYEQFYFVGDSIQAAHNTVVVNEFINKDSPQYKGSKNNVEIVSFENSFSGKYYDDYNNFKTINELKIGAIPELLYNLNFIIYEDSVLTKSDTN